MESSLAGSMSMNGLNTGVSVIIRTKDRQKLLKQAVNSVISQSFRPIELVVVNDGGSDVKPLFVELLKHTSEIELNLIQHEESVGRANAANAGLYAASCAYCLFLDDDDYFDSGHVQSLMETVEQSSKGYALVAAHCQARAVHIDQDGSEHLLSLTGHELSENQIFYQNSLPILTVLLPTVVREYGVAFDDQFDLFEDWDFWLQVSQHCRFVFSPQASCAYRIHEGASGVREQERQFDAFIQVYQKWLPKLENKALFSLLANSHQWREAYIADIQARNQAELNRIGAMHTHALETIAAKDKEIESLKLSLNAINNILNLPPIAFVRRCKRYICRKLFARKH